ncbi:MAG: VWA domain-containing protein [Pseudomonadota bacterium]
MAKDDKISPSQKQAQDITGKTQVSSTSEIDAFLQQVKTLAPQQNAQQRGRLIFAMDATMSRRPTWDMALSLQAQMFHEVAAIGGLDVQLVYFRGFSECQASKWVSDAKALANLMAKVECIGGQTQIGRVLTHARYETDKKKVNALVYVGDCMEEKIDDLAAHAGELGLLGVPLFVFQEGNDKTAEVAFREISRLSGGAFFRFDAGAAHQLRELLSAVAVYAAGGQKALIDHSKRHGGQAKYLLEQLT